MIPLVLSSAYLMSVNAESKGDTMEKSVSNPSTNEGQISWEFAKNNRDLIEFCTLVCARDVDTHLATQGQLERAARGLRELCVTKVYLETYRSGYRSQGPILRSAKEFFLKEGFDVGGCITPTAGGEFGTKCTGSHSWLCYSSEKTRADMASLTVYTATLFDEVMFDDFLCTDCECDTCRQLRGNATWPEFRIRQMNEISRDFILRPAHEVNPEAKIIIKYPQWYDNFHNLGYDARGESDSFDYIWVGCETRNPDTKRFGFVEPYESYFIYRWLGSVAGDKTRGGWFDVFDCNPRVYVYQGYQTVLAGAREILLFNFYHTVLEPETEPLMAAFKEHLPRYYDLAKLVRGKVPRGMHAYKPVNSDAANEDFIFDYIGMLGIPLVPCSEFPADARSVLLATHAASDDNIVQKVKRHVSSGGSVVATPGFLMALGANSDILALFGYGEMPSVEEAVEISKFEVDGATCASDEPVEMVRLPEAVDATKLVSALLDNGDKVPVLTVKQTDAGGTATLVNLRTRDTGGFLLMDQPVSFLKLPESVVNKLRETVLPPIGIEMTAPARVALYPFEDNLLVLYNYNEASVSVRLRLAVNGSESAPDKLYNPWQDEEISASAKNRFEIELGPDEIAPFQLR
jgi:hypothetical protein